MPEECRAGAGGEQGRCRRRAGQVPEESSAGGGGQGAYRARTRTACCRARSTWSGQSRKGRREQPGFADKQSSARTRHTACCCARATQRGWVALKSEARTGRSLAGRSRSGHRVRSLHGPVLVDVLDAATARARIEERCLRSAMTSAHAADSLACTIHPHEASAQRHKGAGQMAGTLESSAQRTRSNHRLLSAQLSLLSLQKTRSNHRLLSAQLSLLSLSLPRVEDAAPIWTRVCGAASSRTIDNFIRLEITAFTSSFSLSTLLLSPSCTLCPSFPFLSFPFLSSLPSSLSHVPSSSISGFSRHQVHQVRRHNRDLF